MQNNTQTPNTRTFASVSPQETCSTKLGPADTSLGTNAASGATFPIFKIALEEHPRVSAWAGLAEGCQILFDAEEWKGGSLSKTELRALFEIHLDAYEPNWAFHRTGISDEWMGGWSHAFQLATQQVERAHYPDSPDALASQPYGDTNKQEQPICFRRAKLNVYDAEAFRLGAWQGQMTGVDEREGQLEYTYVCQGEVKVNTASSVRLFDEVLDVVADTGNLGLDYVVGYILAFSDALLSGRQRYAAKDQMMIHPI